MVGAFPVSGLVLGKGGHDERADGVCVMEAVAWFMDEEHTDQPQCVAQELREPVICVNDSLSDAGRQRLIEFIPLLAGTRGDGKADARRAISQYHKQRLLGRLVQAIAAIENPAASAGRVRYERLQKIYLILLSHGGVMPITYVDLLEHELVTEDELVELVRDLIKGEEVETSG